MTVSVLAIIMFCTLLIRDVYGSHFLGGTITWRPLNESSTGTPVAIVITQTYSFNYTAVACTNAMILNHSFIPNSASLLPKKLQCVTNCASGAVGYPNLSVFPYCIDFSAVSQSSVGQRSDTVYLQSGDDFSASFASGAWRSLATVIGGNWTISTHINVQPRSDNGLYNSAPVATMMSPINLPFNNTVAIQIPVADDDGDTLRCRWATNTNGVDECGSVCPPGSLPPNTIIYPNCTIIITGENISDAYAVAVVVEDFINATSTTPLSSVPVQFLVRVIDTSSCATPPEIVGIPPEDSCTPVIVGQIFTSQLIAINSCGANVSINDIATLSLAGAIQSNITEQNSTTYFKSFSWTPTSAQLGYQVMCALAVDSQGAQSAQSCFNFYVTPNAITDCPGKITLTTTLSSTTTSTLSTSTSTTSNSTSSTVTIANTTTGRKENAFDWPLFGSVMGVALLAALALCCCLCCIYICPLAGRTSEDENDDKPISCHMERGSSADCNWSDRSSSADTSLGHYMNIDTPPSNTQTNRTIRWSNNESDLTTSNTRKDGFPLKSSNHDRHDSKPVPRFHKGSSNRLPLKSAAIKSEPSRKNHTSVERIPIRKRKIGTRDSPPPLSSIVTAIQKKKINHHSVTRVKRIS